MATTIDDVMDDFLGETVELTLKVSELVDLIEIGAIAEHESGWEFEILAELRRLFTELAQNINESADEV